MKSTHIIVLVIMAIVVVSLGLNLSSNASIYSDFEYAKSSGETVHIVGSWVNRDEAHYDASQDMFSFYMKDTTQTVQLVKYHDPKPVNFEQAEKVVIVGAYNKDAFEAEKIIMKCPSKMEGRDITAGESNL